MPNPLLIPDKLSYSVGESVKLSFMNPFAGDSRLVVRWGNMFELKHASFALSGEGETSVTLPAPLGEECRTGCQLHGVLLAPRNNARSLASNVPLSTRFDLAAPKALVIAEQVTIDVDNDDALRLDDVEIETDAKDDTTSPGLLFFCFQFNID